MTRSLVIGYGNPFRMDDGVGLVAVNLLRARLGVPPVDCGEEGATDTDLPFDTLFLQQLTPELAETVQAYDHLYLVDAHTGIYQELVHRERLAPHECPGLVSHILKPEHLLALALSISGRAPETVLYSVRGYNFDFGEQLSPSTAEGVEQVVSEIWAALAPQVL